MKDVDKPFYRSRKFLALAMVCAVFVLAVAANVVAAIVAPPGNAAPVADSVLAVLAAAIAAGLPVLLHAQGKADVAALDLPPDGPEHVDGIATQPGAA